MEWAGRCGARPGCIRGRPVRHPCNRTTGAVLHNSCAERIRQYRSGLVRDSPNTPHTFATELNDGGSAIVDGTRRSMA